MKNTHPILLVILFFCVSVVVLNFSLAEETSSMNLGEKLERQIWTEIVAQNWQAVEGMIAPCFQSVHPDGARDRAAEMELMKKLKPGKPVFSNFKVTENGDTLIVTYMVAIPETIHAERLSDKPAARVSVWQKTGQGWQWITHANLNPM